MSHVPVTRQRNTARAPTPKLEGASPRIGLVMQQTNSVKPTYDGNPTLNSTQQGQWLVVVVLNLLHLSEV